MTDGDFTSGGDGISSANELKDNFNVDLFSVTLNNVNLPETMELVSYMNHISSSECTCYPDNTNPENYCKNQTPSSQCGDITANCRNVNDEFEECETGQPGCGSDCQWTDQSLKRNYYTDDPDELVSMYQYIAGAIPVNQITIIFNLNNYSVPISGSAILDFIIDISNLSCIQGQPNNLPLSIDFTGPPDMSVTLSNLRYYYCPWP
jgi:hypothetical protein